LVVDSQLKVRGGDDDDDDDDDANLWTVYKLNIP
jgi:hypothetical protein